jgi:hypothetical protein
VTQGRSLLALVFLVTLPLVTPKIRASDEIEYFSYLPSLLFDHDLEFGNEYQYFYEHNPKSLELFRGTFLEKREPETGRHINFGPIGSALVWSPFYLLAHAIVVVARVFGAAVPANGLAAPYVAAVCYASALYGFLGLLLIHDALRRFARVAEPAASWTVVALWLATPAFYYMTVAPGFSHAPSLFAVSLLLWLWLRARAEGGDSIGVWAGIGAAAGLAGLVREQDALFIVAPATWLLGETLRRRDWRHGAGRFLALGLTAAVVFVPQLFVYRILTGAFHPSRMVSGKLDYTSPHFLEVLFDPGHGLFVWSPLLLVGTGGLLWAVARGRDGVAALLGLAFLLQAWINGALYTWTQGGAFGSRRFVAATAVFAWGLAWVVSALTTALGRRWAAGLLCVFVWWNGSLMVQFGLKLMDRQRLDWPRVAINQFVEVPPRLGRVGWLLVTDRERLAREGVAP